MWRGVGLLHCSMDDFSKVDKTRIKVLIKFSSERMRWSLMSPWKKKTYQWLKKLLWCCCKRDLLLIILCTLGCLNLTGGCHFSNLRHVCGDSFHALQSPGVSGVEMKIYERSLQALLSSAPRAQVLARLAQYRRACSQANGGLKPASSFYPQHTHRYAGLLQYCLPLHV